jgi:uncharacterized protein involved in response to NO
MRVGAAFATEAAAPLIEGAGAAWITAFWLFAIGYGPSLSRPRGNMRE